MNAADRKALKLIVGRVDYEVADARSRIVGLEVRLKRKGDRYDGRLGVVTEIMPGASGGLLALLMILRCDGTDYLNSDGASRSYRPIDQLDFTGRRVFGPVRKPARAA